MQSRFAASRVFIGSSSEALDIANSLQELLFNPGQGTYAQVWNQGVTPLSASTIESLLRAAAEVDFAVFLLTPDDVVGTRGQHSPLPRDNVLFELGLFMGILGRERVFLVYQTGVDTRILSDLSGVTYAPFELPSAQSDISAHLGPAANRIRTQVRALGPRRQARMFQGPDDAHQYMYDLMAKDDVRSIHHLSVSEARYSRTAVMDDFPKHLTAFLERGGTRYWYLYREYPGLEYRGRFAQQFTESFSDKIEVKAASSLMPIEPRFSMLVFGNRAAVIIDQPHLAAHEFACVADSKGVELCHRLFRAYWEFGAQ